MQSASVVSILGKALIAGILIGIGGTVYLLCENKYLGGFLFSFGLFCIIRYGFALYTGKVGYIPDNRPAYLLEVVLTFLGNLIGTGLAAGLIRLTRIGVTIQANAAASMAVKTGDTHISRLILGFFCGILMYFAVDNGKQCTADKLDTALVFGTAVPIMVFIFCGFNHSIADGFYFFASLTVPSEVPSGLMYLFEVMLGNALGGICVPCIMKLCHKFS